MKFPDVFNQFLHKPPERQEAYLSLVLEAGSVQAAVWTLTTGKKPHVSEAVIEELAGNSWEKRLEACDRAIARLAEKEGRDDFEKVVLGLPVYYLTSEDDIASDVRGHIKTITEELELTPIGFVPIHQAVIHAMRQEEGVPTSAILLEAGPDKTTVILYKVGVIVGRVHIANDDLVAELERALKGFKELEVLPSRVLLYGSVQETLEGYKRDLLKHPWPTRANFLHYPKIEILPLLSLAGAVSLAGASELATQVGKEAVTQATPATRVSPSTPARPGTPVKKEAEQGEKIEESIPVGEVESEDEHTEEADATQEPEVIEDDVIDSGALENESNEADDNLVEVAPEVLGFRENVDILEHPPEAEKKVIQETVEIIEGEKKGKGEELRETISRFVSRVHAPRERSIAIPKTGFFVLFIVVLLVGVGGWLTYWVLPKTSITILQVPKIIIETSSVTVSPTATLVDASSKIVPGQKQEKTVSGEKTIAVTGQKDMGDPARGTVTVYNKSLSGKQLKKGAVLVAGNLSFTLDTDISIASASESLASGSVTYGKANAAVTAVKLGPQSNLPRDTEFSVKDTSSSVMVARNDAAISGGTSKVVTVVSRADYDTLITGLTKELIIKAKAELASSVVGGERLIDETIKTTVTQKKFDAELDQEIRDLHGSITVAISGVSYKDEDIASLFADLVAANVPTGYTLRKSGERMNATNVKLQKDGSISMAVGYQGQALPEFDVPAIKQKLAGKSVTAVSEELKVISGVGGVEIGKVTGSLWGQNLPANAGNITISVAVLE